MNCRIIEKYVDNLCRPHRLDGPALIYSNGYKEWYLNGKYHREEGPARIWPNGEQEWYVDGKLHRLDGPAIEWASGIRYWVDEQQYSKQDFPKAVIMFSLNCDYETAEMIIGAFNDRA